MAETESNGRRTTLVIALVVSLISGGGVTIFDRWVLNVGRQATIDAEMKSIREHQREVDANVARLDERGSRTLPIVEQRLTMLETVVNSRTKLIEDLLKTSSQVSPLEQAAFDRITDRLLRVEDQQKRIIEALDNTYNILQEHLRNETPKQKPLRKEQ